MRRQGTEVPLRQIGTLSKARVGLLWESPMLTAEVVGRASTEVTVKSKDNFSPSVACLLGCVVAWMCG